MLTKAELELPQVNMRHLISNLLLAYQELRLGQKHDRLLFRFVLIVRWQVGLREPASLREYMETYVGLVLVVLVVLLWSDHGRRDVSEPEDFPDIEVRDVFRVLDDDLPSARAPECRAVIVRPVNPVQNLLEALTILGKHVADGAKVFVLLLQILEVVVSLLCNLLRAQVVQSVVKVARVHVLQYWELRQKLARPTVNSFHFWQVDADVELGGQRKAFLIFGCNGVFVVGCYALA